MTTRLRVLSALLCFAAASPAAAQEPPLATVLQRAGAYVAMVGRAVSGIVAEERYRQEWVLIPRGMSPNELRHRELVSDLLIVKLETAGLWLQFRDVFDVDGESVRDRDERLMKLFVQPAGSPTQQLDQILSESTRYNIGNIERNINTPLFAMFFLEPRYQTRFRFFRTKDRNPALSTAIEASRLPGDAWVIRFEEATTPTLLRNTRTDGDLPTHGRFWIDPATGRVLMTELVAEDRTLRATINVRFRTEPVDGMLLPLSMRERYEGRRNKSLIEGVATYDKFRQFTVNTDQTFLLKK